MLTRSRSGKEPKDIALEALTDRANLRNRECFYREKADDDQYYEGMYIVGQEAGNRQQQIWYGLRGLSCVALIPPTNVYTTTPTGSKKVAAIICIPVNAEIAAEAPSSMFATAKRLFTKHKNMNTKCAIVPGIL